MPFYECGGQRTTGGNWFSPFTIWVLATLTQVIRFGSRHPYTLSHLANLTTEYFKSYLTV